MPGRLRRGSSSIIGSQSAPHSSKIGDGLYNESTEHQSTYQPSVVSSLGKLSIVVGINGLRDIANT